MRLHEARVDCRQARVEIARLRLEICPRVRTESDSAKRCEGAARRQALACRLRWVFKRVRGRGVEV
jgi:hypothetical protein